MTYPFDTTQAYYTFVEDGLDALRVVDSGDTQHDGTLSANATWNDLGLKLNGTQHITVPNHAVQPAGSPFTIFLCLQSEKVLTPTPEVIMQWGGQVSVTLDSVHGLVVSIGNNRCEDFFFPIQDVPFSVVVRYGGVDKGGKLDVRATNNGNEFASVSTLNDVSAVYEASNPVIGPFTGTLVHGALYDRYVSNGRTRQVFASMNDELKQRSSFPSTRAVQSIFGVSAITHHILQTLVGLARISGNSVQQTQLLEGVSRILGTQVQSMAGLSRITATQQQGLVGVTRLTVTQQQTLSGTGAINIRQAQELIGLASIFGTQLKGLAGLSRITATQPQELAGSSWINLRQTQTLGGLADIYGTQAQTLSGTANIT